MGNLHTVQYNLLLFLRGIRWPPLSIRAVDKHTGATAPEGDIFSEAMNISSTVCLLIMTIRYFQLKHRAARFMPYLERFNMMSLTAGLVSVLGVTLIANFPSAKVRVMPFHLTVHALQESSFVAFVRNQVFLQL